jgi:hypothetical protein
VPAYLQEEMAMSKKIVETHTLKEKTVRKESTTLGKVGKTIGIVTLVVIAAGALSKK